MMKVMKWPLKTLIYKKFHVSLTLHGLEKFLADDSKFCVDIKWRGPKRTISPRFRSIKREHSTEVQATMDGRVEWEQEFECECTLALTKENGFYPWEVYFALRKITQNGSSKPKSSVLGSGYLNLGELAPVTGNSRQRTKIPVLVDDTESALSVTVEFEELRTVQEAGESIHRIMAPAIPCISGNGVWDRDDLEDMGSMGPKPVRSILTGLRTKKSRVTVDCRTSDEGSPQDSPNRSESDSVDEESEVVDDGELTSFRYGRIAGTYMYNKFPNEEENLVFNGVPVRKLAEETSSSDSDSQSSMKKMLSWRKRKLSFRSPKARGEPLLNKAYADTGGDEIDWDRRQSESPEESLERKLRLSNEKQAAWDFGDRFQVGSWEQKELTSRDGHMKLSASVFLASIDQRSESAAGESACTALVAVIADWLHRHSTYMPSRAEFDAMIRDGSAEWRKLCQDSTYKDRFPDGHFDLETVVEAGVRPLKVNPEKSFVGFFQPEGLGDSSGFLEGAMSFDNIWDEVEKSGNAVYIISWNDHFFVLKVEDEKFYIIDTLGERLYEGCDQAYLLKFDNTTFLSYKKEPQAQEQQENEVKKEEVNKEEVKEEASKICGKGACREFIKGFFAAVPLRQLQCDLKKGMVSKEHLHRRLQIEFHFTTAVSEG